MARICCRGPEDLFAAGSSADDTPLSSGVDSTPLSSGVDSSSFFLPAAKVPCSGMRKFAICDAMEFSIGGGTGPQSAAQRREYVQRRGLHFVPQEQNVLVVAAAKSGDDVHTRPLHSNLSPPERPHDGPAR